MVGQHSRRRCLHGILGLVALALVSCAQPGPEEERKVNARTVEGGWLDLSDWRPESEGPIQLSGTWDFYWRELLVPSAADPESAPVPIAVPRFWHRTEVAAGQFAGRGFGTYRLRIRLPPDPPQLAVRFGNVDTAIEVFAQGESVWRVGQVAVDPDEAIPGYRPGVALLPRIDRPVLDLIVQVSSLETARGGLDDPVWLGPAEDLILARARTLTLLGLLVGGLLTTGLYHLFLFVLRRRSQISLYFGMFCLSAVGRLMCSDELLVLEIWPEIPWSLLVKGGYFFAFMIVAAFALYLRALWPRTVPAWFFQGAYGSAGFAGVVILLTPPSFFTRGLIFLQVSAVTCLLVALVVLVSAVRSRAEGIGLYSVGFLLVALGALHDAAVWQGLIDSPFHWGHIGVFLFLLVQSVILAQRFSRSLTTVEKQRGELQDFVDRLEREQRERKRYEELSLAASGLAHETKNPLGIIRGLAQRLTTAPDVDQSSRRRAGQILDQADRAASRLGDFLSYARLRDPKVESVDLEVLMRYASEILAPDLEAKKIRCRVETGGESVLADEEMLLQIVLNLMLNSIAASDDQGHLELRFEGPGDDVDLSQPPAGRLSVIDDGAGIAEDFLEQVRKPYVTGRADGHGLGLALVERLAELHGWRLLITSRLGEGTCVHIDGISLSRGAAEPSVTRARNA